MIYHTGKLPNPLPKSSTTWLVNSQPEELGSMNLLGVNRLMGLSNSLSTNNDKRATKRSLQVQRKSSRGLTVPFILKRSLTSQVMSLPINLPWLLISIGWKIWWYGCSQKWAWEWGWIQRLGQEWCGYLWGQQWRGHMISVTGHISRYLCYLSTSTTYNCCLESLTALRHSWYHSPSYVQFVMTYCDMLQLAMSWFLLT